MNNTVAVQVPLEAVHDMAVHDMVRRLQSGEVPGVSRIAFDLTPKPPGTTEWE
ncbi:hypothetical protein T492DRAFT_910808 [Pavlovales sp. CCMP2436]|nr:hypothetical protein T492DRAFT_910808 [Pavlovales sp. CCMP2436]